MAGTRKTTPEVDAAREAQLAYHTTNARTMGDLLQRGNRDIKDWSYRPPADDDWREWKGVTRWFAGLKIYEAHIYREVALEDGRGPFYCPMHDLKPEKGWQAMTCIDCEWTDSLYDEALSRARAHGKAWKQGQWTPEMQRAS